MIAPTCRDLPKELVEIQSTMQHWARHYGLDFFPTLFELVDSEQLSAIAAYGGFPTRYPHWRFGMEFERLAKGYAYGLQKIYELVINNDPCYAYLLDSNSLADHKLVMAHVYGHCDFFKNNEWFRRTNRHMIDEMANHGNRIRRYMDRFGVETVESYIDACLSIEDLIDLHAPFVGRTTDRPDRYAFPEATAPDEPPRRAARFPAKEYMEPFINPLDRTESAVRKPEVEDGRPRVPEEPHRDVLGFVLEHAPLKPWQVDVMSMVRDEAYYFAPQGQTKIMNEGWATYWHSTIMTRHGLDARDVVCYADHCSGALASSPARLNPYKLGVELFRDIEDRWDHGRFGPDYDACDDLRERRHWNTRAGLGRQKIFEVRRIHNDLTFIDEFLTLEFCERHRLFSFGFNPSSGMYEIESRRFDEIKRRLLFNLTNLGRPIIYVKDGNFRNRGELYLEHRYGGAELHQGYAEDTLRNLHRLWSRPVHIETIRQDKKWVVSFDGQKLESSN